PGTQCWLTVQLLKRRAESRRQKAEGRRQRKAVRRVVKLSLATEELPGVSDLCFLPSAFCLLPSALLPRLDLLGRDQYFPGEWGVPTAIVHGVFQRLQAFVRADLRENPAGRHLGPLVG